MNLKQTRTYYNTKPVEFVVKERYELIEDNEFVPRFSLKNVKDIANIPINEPIKYNEQTMIKAIKYGMIFLINYKGEEDTHFAGHERVIYPMVLGRSTKGKQLLRGWHLNGWSVSQKRHINKIWRLFRTDRILSMTFTGSFYRLPPAGYNMYDKGMRGGIIARADFNEIRRKIYPYEIFRVYYCSGKTIVMFGKNETSDPCAGIVWLWRIASKISDTISKSVNFTIRVFLNIVIIN